MNEPSSDLSARSLPPWLTEAADVLWARRRLVVAAAIVTALIGIAVAALTPSLLPPRAIVGAAVGLAAVLLAAAIGLAVDAADLVVRGGRHIRAAGADVAASVGRDVGDVGPLVARVALKAQGTRVRVALVPASRDAGAPGARASALAESLAKTGRRVLVADLTRPATPTPGLSEVIAGTSRLADVARLDEELYLARVPVGMDPARAIDGFAEWVQHLPSDLEVLIVALPPLAEPGVISAAAVADLVLIQVEADRTERVDLIAALDAVDAAGLSADVILVDPAKSWSPRSEAGRAADARPGDEDVGGPVVEQSTDVEPAAEELDQEPDDLEALAALAALDADSVTGTDTDSNTDPLGLEPVETSGPAAGVVAGGVAVGGAVGADLGAQDPARVTPSGHHPRDLAHVWEESDDEAEPELEPESEEVDEAETLRDAEPEVRSAPEPEDLPAAEVQTDPEPIADDVAAPDPEVGSVPAGEREPEPAPAPVAADESAREADSQPSPAAVAKPKDEIDELAREAVRTTAALYALAEEVWRREDAQ